MAVRQSCALHHPWVTPPDKYKEFQAYLKRKATASHLAFLVILRNSGDLVGVISLGHIIHGPLRSAFVGYYVFTPHAGKGLMREGMRLVLKHAFQKLKLHRLEANIQPGNNTSIQLVRGCGFVREGFSRRYLKVGGQWRDHERWAILAEDLPRTAK